MGRQGSMGCTMTARRTMTASEKEYAAGCLRASALDNEGKPDWAAVSSMTGRDPKVLRRIWMEIGQGAAPQRAASAVTDGSAAPLQMSDVEWWVWRWAQHQAEIARAESDVAREKLLRAQDDLRANYRAAVEREAKMTATTREEVEAKVRAMIDTMPPTLAMVAAESLRRRGFA